MNRYSVVAFVGVFCQCRSPTSAKYFWSLGTLWSGKPAVHFGELQQPMNLPRCFTARFRIVLPSSPEATSAKRKQILIWLLDFLRMRVRKNFLCLWELRFARVAFLGAKPLRHGTPFPAAFVDFELPAANQNAIGFLRPTNTRVLFAVPEADKHPLFTVVYTNP